MADDDRGLLRALHAGEKVILATGATAVARASYPAGYSGDVDILLDGVEESERADGLTLLERALPENPVHDDAAASASQPAGETRGRSHRMED